MIDRILKVSEISVRCLTEEAGVKLLQILKPCLDRKEIVTLDFRDITMFASLFFNNSLAPLLKDFDPQFLEEHLKMANLNEAGKKSLTRSMENASEFFKLGDAARQRVLNIVDAASDTDHQA